jgi:hypothetical protein
VPFEKRLEYFTEIKPLHAYTNDLETMLFSPEEFRNRLSDQASDRDMKLQDEDQIMETTAEQGRISYGLALFHYGGSD